ncbi:hypothetical protein [Streptomyces justiciae]|uniref:hypothetical protein n=1 Tax=Streptomyces justiciae TaxID=2780140 RepID=UPI0018813132|nr:hypothetical protein [Streptomyces justiciae]MBE8470201.1 hypothetical protein [Streptomyces justiciae]
MGYEVEAAIAGGELLRAASRDVPGAHVVPMLQGLSLLPMIDEVLDAVTDGSPVGALGFWKLPGGFEGVLAQWSAAGPVAYVEAEYFGGVGQQRAAVWDGGTLALGPLERAARRGLRTVSPVSPVSQALRLLGVRRSLGEDEFSAVGLDRNRRTDDWILSGTR